MWAPVSMGISVIWALLGLCGQFLFYHSVRMEILHKICI